MRLRFLLSATLLAPLFFAPGANAQDDIGWRISPEHINIQAGEERRLQLLDDSAKELHGATWAVDALSLAELQEQDGYMVLRALAEGTVRVSATIGTQTRYREIKIWPLSEQLPPGTTRWGVHPVGREIRDLAAVPTPSGPNQYSLEQAPDFTTYLRANATDGIQMWRWTMPEKIADAELVCGDWLGGALLSANRSSSFTLYAVGIDGKTRWQHEIPGFRKGHSISLKHQVFILSQLADGTAARLTVFNEQSGETEFQLPLPPSHETEFTIAPDGTRTPCATRTLPTTVSRVSVNMDGFTYLAFTKSERTLQLPACGSASSSLHSSADELIVWQVHPDGTLRSTVAISNSANQPSGASIYASPTGEIITDNNYGLLMSVRTAHPLNSTSKPQPADEFVYRLDPDGNVLFSIPMPKYTGALHDEMVIGQDNIAFATRGGLVVAFDLTHGKDLWHWDSGTNGITVFAALANGDVLVQTPAALVEVHDADNARELMQGKFIMDWQGHLYRQHD